MGRRPIVTDAEGRTEGVTDIPEPESQSWPTDTEGEPPIGVLPNGTLNVVGQDDEMTDEEEGQE